ncbi:MAG: hypothetical protein LBE74_07135 [Treponema sp.]|nr:hypothetical protein [Treponema sp.]
MNKGAGYDKEWTPGTRTAILAMCRNWLAYMTAAVRTAWGVSDTFGARRFCGLLATAVTAALI